jgi:hypothetical protein
VSELRINRTYMRSLTIGLRRSGLTYIARSKSCQRNVVSTKPRVLCISVRKLLKILYSQFDCGGAVWGKYILRCLCVCYSYIVSGPSGVVSPNIPDPRARRFAWASGPDLFWLKYHLLIVCRVQTRFSVQAQGTVGTWELKELAWIGTSAHEPWVHPWIST